MSTVAAHHHSVNRRVARLAPAVVDEFAEARLRPEAAFAYRAWLDGKGEIDTVRDSVAEWLSLHGQRPEATFVYCAWLNAHGEIDLVWPFMVEWLALHKLQPDTQFVYRAWLDAKGRIDKVRSFIAEWLPFNWMLPEAGFVYRAWLDARGDIALVRASIAQWVPLHCLRPDAGFVFRAWLDARGDVDVIRTYLPGWLATHGRAADSDFLFRAWLQAGGDFAAIAAEALAWVHGHREDRHAVYLLKDVARQRHLPDESVRDVLAWCRRYATEEDALWRLWYLGEKAARRGLEADALEAIDAVTRAASASRLPPKKVQLLAGIMSNVARMDARGGRHDLKASIINRWLLMAGEPRRPESDVA